MGAGALWPVNEREDALAKEAAAQPKHTIPVDVRSLSRAVTRTTRWRWQAGWHRSVTVDRVPGPVLAATREAAVDVHQLRAGHCARSEQYLHRIGRRSIAQCA